MIAYYVVQSFYVDQFHQIQADEPVVARNAEHAVLLAENLSERKSGVVAFSRKADLEIGEYEDAIILAQYGHIPFEDSMLEMAS